MNETFETPRRMSNNQTRGIYPTKFNPQAMAKELPPHVHFVNSHRLSRKEKNLKFMMVQQTWKFTYNILNGLLSTTTGQVLY